MSSRRLLAASLIVAALAACDKKPKTEPAAPDAAAAVPEAAAAAPAADAGVVGATTMEVPAFVVSTDPADIKKGEELFASKGCVACHKIGGGKLVGPDLKGVTARRDETWLKKMILHPDVMLKEDEVAKKLLAENLVPMPNQNVDPVKELPFIVAYLKSVEK